MTEERINSYVVSIKLNNGESIKVRQVGHSHWEAIDRVYNEYHHQNPELIDRNKYTAKLFNYKL
jgi:hypothetical protein